MSSQQEQQLQQAPATQPQLLQQPIPKFPSLYELQQQPPQPMQQQQPPPQPQQQQIQQGKQNNNKKQ